MQFQVQDPVRWLIASNLLWVAGGVLAYYTPMTLVVGTAIAVVPAFAAFRAGSGVWNDRGTTYSVGTWAVMAMWVAIPYVASENGVSLWSEKGYVVLGMFLATFGMLLVNIAAWQVAEGVRGTRFAAFHGAVALVAAWIGGTTAPQLRPIMLRGHEILAPDLVLAPAIAAAPGIMWVLLLWRARGRSPA